MNSHGKVLLLGLGTALCAFVASGVTPLQKVAEYGVIKTRNPLGLVDPPPPVVVKPDEGPKKEAEPPPNVELTGLFHNSRKGKTVAMFLVEKKKGEKKESFMWSVGEGGEGMKVLAINESEKTVRLKVRELESTITFSEKKAASPPAVNPTVAGGARVPGQPVRNPRAPGMTEPEAQQIETTRRGGLGRSTSSMSAVGGAMPTRGNYPQANALNAVAPRTLKVPGTQQQAGGQADVPSLTPHETAVLIEVNREVLKQTGQINLMPPLPPTSLTTPEDRARIIAPSNPYQQQ